jgi:hypothetical protein
MNTERKAFASENITRYLISTMCNSKLSLASMFPTPSALRTFAALSSVVSLLWLPPAALLSCYGSSGGIRSAGRHAFGFHLYKQLLLRQYWRVWFIHLFLLESRFLIYISLLYPIFSRPLFQQCHPIFEQQHLVSFKVQARDEIHRQVFVIVFHLTDLQEWILSILCQKHCNGV